MSIVPVTNIGLKIRPDSRSGSQGDGAAWSAVMNMPENSARQWDGRMLLQGLDPVGSGAEGKIVAALYTTARAVPRVAALSPELPAEG